MANPLENIKGLFDLEFLKKLKSKSGSSVLGVDVGSSSIKVVQLRKKGGAAVLETYGELALGPYAGLEVGRATNFSTDKIIEALNDLLREANVTTKNCGVSIPFSASLISLIPMPKMPQKQLTKMIPIEARKYIPVPIGEVALDWFVIPEAENKFLSKESNENEKGVTDKKTENVHILLVAIHNQTLAKYNDVVKGAELEPSFFEIEIFSTMRSVISQNLSPIMVVDMGAATTKVYVMEYGIVKVSHIINRGAQDITLSLSKALGISVARAEELKREYGLYEAGGRSNLSEATLLTLQYVFSEINRVLLNYQKKYNKNVGKVVLTGGGSILKGLLELAAKNLETDVTMGDPFSKIETPAFLEDVLREAGPEFAVAVGLALRKLQELE